MVIPGARFVPVPGDYHMPLPGNPAFDQVLAEALAFVGADHRQRLAYSPPA